jgi:hypothetical protein
MGAALARSMAVYFDAGQMCADLYKHDTQQNI